MRYEQAGANLMCAIGLVCVLGGCGGGSSGGGGGGSDGDNPDPGDGNTITVSGTISGAQGGVTLALNGRAQSFASPDFSFTHRLANGAAYTVSFVRTDNGQSCRVENGAGIANENVSGISVVCLPLNPEIRFSDARFEGNLAMGDFNSDDHLDAALVLDTLPEHPSGSGNKILRIMWGNGAGAFTQGPEYAVTNHVETPAVADLNDDGIDDLIVPQGDNVMRYLGQSGANPVLQSGFVFYSHSMGRLFALDATGDGHQDFLTWNAGPCGNATHSNCAFFWTFPGLGDGSFGDMITSGSYVEAVTVPEVIALGFFRAWTMITGDFDGDQTTDLLTLTLPTVMVNDYPDWPDEHIRLAVFSGNGDGSFSYPDQTQALPLDLNGGTNSLNVASRPLTQGDIDLDGDLDIAIASAQSFVMIMHNDGSGVFTQGQNVNVGDEPVQIALVDLNLDGFMDLVSANQSSKTLGISWGQSDGSFGMRGEAETRFTERQLDNRTLFGDMVIVDLDGNSYPDIVFADADSRKEGFAPGSLQLIMNPGL